MNENTITRPLDEIEDDGSLACLGLDTDRERKVFSCPAARQIDLVGKTFWVLDYFGDIVGKDGNKKYLFKIIPNLDDPSTEERKVWTGSPEIMHVLDKLRELDKFPRMVTLMKHNRGAMYFK